MWIREWKKKKWLGEKVMQIQLFWYALYIWKYRCRILTLLECGNTFIFNLHLSSFIERFHLNRFPYYNYINIFIIYYMYIAREIIKFNIMYLLNIFLVEKYCLYAETNRHVVPVSSFGAILFYIYVHIFFFCSDYIYLFIFF